MTIFIALTQSLIVAYRCKLELWDDDEVKKSSDYCCNQGFLGPRGPLVDLNDGSLPFHRRTNG